MKSIEKLKQQQVDARTAHLQKLATACAQGFEQFTPEDTGRLKRAWLEACGEAGAESAVLPTLRPSRRSKYIFERIRGQWIKTHIQRVRLENLFEKWYPDGRKLGDFGQRMKRDLNKIIKREGKLKEQYDKWQQASNAPIILIGESKGHSFATLRTTVYGGRGTITGSGNSSKLKLTNKEPHAFIIDANTGMTEKVAAFIKGFGGKQVAAAAYKKRLAKARDAFEK
jgi:hypothetical protein